jgi:hypothetical protein
LAASTISPPCRVSLLCFNGVTFVERIIGVSNHKFVFNYRGYCEKRTYGSRKRN